ncbi:hypothetical protein LEM8419_00433 [Neolewinella maritima]|uniref:Uncharacterized protein n=1 Tax=Neolewinella maritima TaxID=1383882 RepID=A0ABN8EZ92_9BACT|nr:DUF6702 family protein [Neolewinella maritima]CAH0999137.1 hypothetical protein LEM8419_00433 [Neolewinella maritima]
MHLLLLLVLCFSAAVPPPALVGPAPTHDYHVSKTNVRYVAERRQVQVEMHVFVDDLELAMQDAGAPALELGSEEEHPESERFLTAYLDKHFGIDWNGRPLPVQLVGWELEDDLHGLWIYLAADEVAPADAVRIQNSVLTEYYADQKNIVKVYADEARLGTLLMSRAQRQGSI